MPEARETKSLAVLVDANGWENLASVGRRIQGAHPDFDPLSNGCANVSALVEKTGSFDIRMKACTVCVRGDFASRKGSAADKGAAA